jgi:amidohydrolase
MSHETEIGSFIEAELPHATELRRRLHRIPELGYEEFETAAVIRAELNRLGIAYTAGVEGAPTATIAVIGDPSLPCVALRADIDALPIVEQTGVSYASTHPGRMHACGHDGHIATLVGTAAVLKQLLAGVVTSGDHGTQVPNCCVKFLFQPAEEGGGGAEKLVAAGALDGRIGPKVDAVFGLHGWPGLKVGMIATKPGALLAATDTWQATFIGKGCHAAFPHLGVDPIVVACEAVTNLQQFVSREVNPVEPAVVTVGRIQGGTASNVIPDAVEVEGTARTLTPPLRAKIRESIERRCRGIAAAGGCELKFDWWEGYPPTINDPAMADYVAKVAKATFGEDRFYLAPFPSMGGEDFAYYLEKAPGCFFLVGVEPHGASGHPPLHSDRYDFTDAALGVGMRMFVELVRGWRRGKSE